MFLKIAIWLGLLTTDNRTRPRIPLLTMFLICWLSHHSSCSFCIHMLLTFSLSFYSWKCDFFITLCFVIYFFSQHFFFAFFSFHMALKMFIVAYVEFLLPAADCGIYAVFFLLAITLSDESRTSIPFVCRRSLTKP